VDAALELDGEIVERQSYLNGTRYLLIEGANGDWSVQLAVTLPREEGEPVEEGDLSLSADAHGWFGLAAGGEHHSRWDDTIDAPVLDLELRYARNPDAESSEPWPSVAATVRIYGDEARLTLSPES